MNREQWVYWWRERSVSLADEERDWDSARPPRSYWGPIIEFASAWHLVWGDDRTRCGRTIPSRHVVFTPEVDPDDDRPVCSHCERLSLRA